VLKPPTVSAFQRLKLEHHKLLSTFSSEFNSRRYTLCARHRWCVTGTPVSRAPHLDLVPMLQFCRCWLGGAVQVEALSLVEPR